MIKENEPLLQLLRKLIGKSEADIELVFQDVEMLKLIRNLAKDASVTADKIVILAQDSEINIERFAIEKIILVVQEAKKKIFPAEITQIAMKNVTAIGDIRVEKIEQNVHYYEAPKQNKSIPSDVRQGSPNFVGRVDDLRGLHEALQKQKIVSVCAVRGMGGVGKTELAIQYTLSKEFQQHYVACYWFSLNEGNLASMVLQKAAPYLAMPEEIQKSDNVYDQVKWCWQNWHPPEGEVLVILDDVKSLDDIPKQAMPINPRFKVMLTTRQRNLSPSFRELQLGVLPEHEALELLKRIVDRNSSSRIEDELETAKEICHYLGYLPLALELAATYLVEDEMLTLGEYWQQLNLQDRSISDEMVKYITAERGVVSAFALSWLRLRDLSPQVAMLLGRFAPADIPWQDLVEPTVKSLGWDEVAVKYQPMLLLHYDQA